MEAPIAIQGRQVPSIPAFPGLGTPALLPGAIESVQEELPRASISGSQRDSVHFRDSITIADRMSRIGSRFGDKETSSAVQVIKPAPLKKFQHQFWDPEVLALRKIYGKIMIRIVVLLVIFMWITIPVYFVSLASQADHVPQLHGWLVNFDNDGELGRYLEEAFTANSLGETGVGKAHLRWDMKNKKDFGSIEDITRAIAEDHAWAAVVVNFNATNNLIEARAIGDKSYNASHAITFLYNQARNEVAANNYIVPYTATLLQEVLSSFSQKFTATHMASLKSSNSSTQNLDQFIRLASQAPQTITRPFWFTMNNVRPYTAPVAGAILLIGSIYICIFSFIVTLTNAAAREIIGPFLTTKSYIIMRIVVPLCAYLPLSFSYAMISLPFHVPFGAKFSYGGGFFIWWIFVYFGMAALGLATEAMVTLLTPRYMGFFLIVLIISNVSGAILPYELQPWFYKYGLSWPVFNLAQATRTIIFKTRNHLGQNAAILIVWVLVSVVTTAVFTWWMRRRDVQSLREREESQRTGARSMSV